MVETIKKVSKARMYNKNILVLTYWSYKDALIQTYTLPYLKMICKATGGKSLIYLFTLEQTRIAITKEEKQQIEDDLSKYNIILISRKYHRFGLIAIAKWLILLIELIVIIFKNKIKTIHAFCTPAGAAGVILSYLTGRKLVIDSYEPHAEAMVENGSWKKNALPFKILFFFEKLQTKRATAFIATTSGMIHYAKQKYNENILNLYVKPACVDLQLFNPEKFKNTSTIPSSLSETITCVYAGKIGGIYYDNEIFIFFSEATKFWKNKFRILFLTSTERNILKTSLSKYEIPEEIIKSLFVPHNEIAFYLSQADFAINPVKPVPSKKYCTSIKDGEYWAMGLPVVISPNISDDSDIIEKENIGAVVDFENLESIRKGIEKIDELLKTDRQLLQAKIRNIAIKYRSYEIAEKIYSEVYKDFC